MRTTKRFTPAVLRRFSQKGRGQGIFEEYRAWHQVSRGDPASRGRSHFFDWNGLCVDLLSDRERVVFLLASMVPGVVDVRAQFPLSLHSAPHELEAYAGWRIPASLPGAKEIALSLGIKLPVVTNDDEHEDWTPTTDLLLTLRDSSGQLSLLAIAFKLAKELSARRKRELLRLEYEYWLRRDVPWLLLTEQLIDPVFAECLERAWYWALHEPLDEATLRIATSTIKDLEGHSLTYVLECLVQRCGSLEIAQHAFWQAVWKGWAPVDLRRGWRPHLPVRLLPEATFWALNPIVARRSAWTC